MTTKRFCQLIILATLLTTGAEVLAGPFGIFPIFRRAKNYVSKQSQNNTNYYYGYQYYDYYQYQPVPSFDDCDPYDSLYGTVPPRNYVACPPDQYDPRDYSDYYRNRYPGVHGGYDSGSYKDIFAYGNLPSSSFRCPEAYYAYKIVVALRVLEFEVADDQIETKFITPSMNLFTNAYTVFQTYGPGHPSSQNLKAGLNQQAETLKALAKRIGTIDSQSGNSIRLKMLLEKLIGLLGPNVDATAPRGDDF